MWQRFGAETTVFPIGMGHFLFDYPSPL